MIKRLTSSYRSVVFGGVLGTEDRSQGFVIPLRKGVVGSVLPMDQALNRVSVVVENEACHISAEACGVAGDLHNRFVIEFQRIGKELCRELKAAFAGHEDTALVCAVVFGCLERTR